MEKILHHINRWRESEKEKESRLLQQQKVNAIMIILFRDNSTQETIQLYDKVKHLLADEMINRLNDSKRETQLIEGYFKVMNVTNSKVKDEAFNQPIKSTDYGRNT